MTYLSDVIAMNLAECKAAEIAGDIHFANESGLLKGLSNRTCIGQETRIVHGFTDA